MRAQLLCFLVLVGFVQPVPFEGGSSGFRTGFLVVTFDDGRDGALKYAAPILAEFGIKATMFAYQQSLLESWEGFLNMAGALKLQNSYGWEFQGHTHTHHDLNNLTRPQLEDEIVSSKQMLIQDGFRPIDSFAYPYASGWDNATVLNLVKQNYEAARRSVGYSDTPELYNQTHQMGPAGCNLCPPDRYTLIGNAIVNDTSVTRAEHYIDKAVASHTILVLVFHQIVQADASFSTFYLASDFRSIMEHSRGKIASGVLQSLRFSEAVHMIFGAPSPAIGEPDSFRWTFLVYIGILGVVAISGLFVARWKSRRYYL